MLINPLFFILINNPKIFLKISPFLKQILKILIILQMPQDNEISSDIDLGIPKFPTVLICLLS